MTDLGGAHPARYGEPTDDGRVRCTLCPRNCTMADGQRAVSTGTLNTPGRMGSVDSEIYICNAAVVAASAIEGCIADPRPYLATAGGAA